MGAVWWYARAPLQYFVIRETSRYQLTHLILRRLIASIARGENVTGARPGGPPRHFWVPEYAASMPQPSISSGMPPREVTQSRTVSAPAFLATAARSGTSCRNPVEVSAWTKATTLGFLPSRAF